MGSEYEKSDYEYSHMYFKRKGINGAKVCVH